MPIWAIADLHLSFGVANKSMDIFGPQWVNHPEKIKKEWLDRVSAQDLVLIAGDISWAMTLEEARPDFEWLDALPGTKVMIKGNHDYWWQAISKVRQALPPSLHVIQNDAFNWKDVSIAGARLWDTYEYDFPGLFSPSVYFEPLNDEQLEEQEKIFLREMHRLEEGLKRLNPLAKVKIAMTHYPPISAELTPSRASALLEKYGVSVCVFGHLHNVMHGLNIFGQKKNIRYLFCAGDYVGFAPIRVLD